jgi:nucleotide-binding universal stress UspA family protein
MRQERIVVGIDGSEPSKQALRWAVHEATLRDATVEVVLAWQFPSLGLTAYGDAKLPLMSPEDIEKASEKAARKSVDEVVGEALEPPITITVREGHPARTLLEAAHDADLVVIGSRGLGGVSGALLGSVSTNVVHHATCPVVVVRRPRD